MVDNQTEQLNAVFRALADPTRRAILQRLTLEDQKIGELAAPFDMSLEAVSKHVRVLERAGLVERSVEGRAHLCRLNALPMHGGYEWLRHYEQFWSRRLDRLESLLRADAGRGKQKKSKTRSKR